MGLNRSTIPNMGSENGVYDGELSALLYIGRFVLFYRGHGAAGADFGKRCGPRFTALGHSRLPTTMAVCGWCTGVVTGSPTRDLGAAAWRCRLFQTLGLYRMHCDIARAGEESMSSSIKPAINRALRYLNTSLRISCWHRKLNLNRRLRVGFSLSN